MRRTKEDAARTRAAIVEGALACFDRYGITSATMEQIAAEAGVTRGAVYHHFGGKGDILRAIREHVSLPLLDEANTELLRRDGTGALDRIERFLAAFLSTLENDARTRQALVVMQFRCEYVGRMGGELDAAARNIDRLAKALETAYREARAEGELAEVFEPQVAAIESTMFLSGLVRLWILHGRDAAIRRNARAAIALHVASRRPAAALGRAPGH